MPVEAILPKGREAAVAGAQAAPPAREGRS